MARQRHNLALGAAIVLMICAADALAGSLVVRTPALTVAIGKPLEVAVAVDPVLRKVVQAHQTPRPAVVTPSCPPKVVHTYSKFSHVRPSDHRWTNPPRPSAGLSRYGHPHVRLYRLPLVKHVPSPPRPVCSAPVVVHRAPPVVVHEPPVVHEPAVITIWVTNSNGSKISVQLTRRGSGYVGPRREYYPHLPSNEQLRVVYGF